ncbi:hypothetical protein [Nocardioides sp.]|uniref:hypothetical protein n=1 Tax=Nocardioides sp. TaxID=35761 RepID=UPI002C0B7A64|nr:hypothetical protein [Nocardioides sp.]HXH78176.1 hypothetical protein [Nocardioides sp.]
MTQSVPLTYDSARDLAGDLLRTLVQHYGDDEEVATVLMHWLEVLGMDGLSLVCVAAVQRTFAECLSPPPADGPPPGALEFRPTEGATR